MSQAKLEPKVVAFIRRHNLLPPGETIVVGVSGGADSVCLLHILAKCQRELDIKIHVAHLNHQLRGVESEADAQYVANLAAWLGVPATIDRQDVAAYRAERNISVEEAARELRYAFFAKVAGEIGTNRIAVGHTRDDQVETILMHILRGTGIAGLCGLAPCSPLPYSSQVTSLAGGKNFLVIRPLLDITREETMSYCQEHQLCPRIDSSNLSLSFFRNRLRLELLPLLRQYNPKIDESLLRLADIAREHKAFLEQYSFALWNEVARQGDGAIYLDRKKLTDLPVALQKQLLRTAIEKLIGDVRDVEASHIEAARGLLGKPTSKRVSLPHGLICQGGYDELVVAKETEHCELLRYPLPWLLGEFPLKVPGEAFFLGWKVTASICAARQPTDQSLSQPLGYRHAERIQEFHTAQAQSARRFSAYFDLHKTGTELFVRSRRPGDRFCPLGMSMPKKVSEFMVDAKIPRSWRDSIPIVCSRQQIIWVVGWRIDDRVKVTEATKETLHLEFVREQ